MQLIPEFLLAAAVMVVGTVNQGTPAPAPDRATPVTASVRFTNNLTSTATLNANDAVLFRDVASAMTSDWATVSDSAVTFKLTVAGEGGGTATTEAVLMNGAQYTVTADPGPAGTPVLKVKHEMAPPPPDSTR
jgi:hypothetical protein